MRHLLSSRPPAPGSRALRRGRSAAFTLLEILLASLAAALILVAVYGIFTHALRLRDSGTRRVRASRQRERAEGVLRGDLQGALVSGGILASTLSGDSTGSDTTNQTHPNSGNFPGYLKFTTTTGHDNPEELYGDVQQVEYYLVADPAVSADAASTSGGILVRAVTRDLLDAGIGTGGAGGAAAAREEQILTGVQSFQVSFYDGANWQTSWQFTGLNQGNAATGTPSATSLASPSAASAGTLGGQTGLPAAIRVDIQQAPATPKDALPPPLEVLVPWTTQPFAAATPATSAGTAAASPSPSPTPSPAPTAAPPANPPPPR